MRRWKFCTLNLGEEKKDIENNYYSGSFSNVICSRECNILVINLCFAHEYTIL